MKKLKYLFMLLPMVMLTSCEANANSTPVDNSTSQSGFEEYPVDLEVRNKDAFRFSSISDFTENGTAIYKMFAPYTDEYTIKSSNVTSLKLYDKKGEVIDEGTTITSSFLKNEIMYLEINNPINKTFFVEVSAKTHAIELPYEINSSVSLDDLSGFSTSISDPLEPAKIAYTKRDDGKGLYVNSNNPEGLSAKEMNTILTRQMVTDKDVFFTFEHNNYRSGKPYYYGYRVTNVGKEDIYVTVKNLGFQVGGSGSWLGEDEWIKFYNLKFMSDTSSFTESQMANYNAYISFDNRYNPENRKPITYRIPKGEYFYAIGGTTADAFNNINVFRSANVGVTGGGCGNGAVIFSVTGGAAEGAFMIYDDENAETINKSEYVRDSELQYGYIVSRNSENDVGAQYVGYDNCHGVVDSDLMWVFNDRTAAGELPVTYENNYFTSSRGGKPYAKINNLITQPFKNVLKWNTHINPNSSSNAVGTDMTNYITVDHETKEPVTIDIEHYDGRGQIANIGNWMVDYIDTITLVNQGDKVRKLTYSMSHTGVILAFIRDKNGLVDASYTPKYCAKLGNTVYGDAIDDRFIYSIEVPAHSVVRYSVDYNLLANSSGNIQHSMTLTTVV